MVKLYITTLVACAIALPAALAQEPGPIPPPAPITPMSSTPATPEQPAPIEPPVTSDTTSPAAPAQPADQQTAAAPVTSSTSAPVASGTGAPVVEQSPHMEFQGDDLSQVFRLLARQAKISLFVSPKV